MQENLKSDQQMNEPWYWRMLDGFFLSQNSTFDVLLKMAALGAIVWIVLVEVREWRNSLTGTNASIVNGCVLPAHLLTSKNLPTLPAKPKGKLTYKQEREWLMSALTEYQVWGVDMVADRRDTVRLCR